MTRLQLTLTATLAIGAATTATADAAMNKSQAESFVAAAIGKIDTLWYGGQGFVSDAGFVVVNRVAIDDHLLGTSYPDATADIQWGTVTEVNVVVNSPLLGLANDVAIELALCHELGHIFKGPLLVQLNLKAQGPRTEIAADLGAAYVLSQLGVPWPDIEAAARTSIFGPTWSGDHPPGSDRERYIKALSAKLLTTTDIVAAMRHVLALADLDLAPGTWDEAHAFTSVAGGLPAATQKAAVLAYAQATHGRAPSGDEIFELAQHGRLVRLVTAFRFAGLTPPPGLIRRSALQAALSGTSITVSSAPTGYAASVVNLNARELAAAAEIELDFMLFHQLGHAVADQLVQQGHAPHPSMIEYLADYLALRMMIAVPGISRSTWKKASLGEARNVGTITAYMQREGASDRKRETDLIRMVGVLP